jgi:glycosyltransferase involved in cell wall biosynthesis
MKLTQNSLTLVLIPAFNDSELLPSITKAIQDLGNSFCPLVVDDGSRAPVDQSSLAPGSLFFRFPANFGLGIATHVAFDHALACGYDALVRVDADGQHPIEAIPRLIAPIASGDADLVVAARTNRHEGSGVRAFAARMVRHYLSWVARRMTNGNAPSDVNSGFFAISSRAVKALQNVQLERFPEPQMYILAGRRGLRIREVAIEQLPREHGSSTITLGRALAVFYRFNIFVLGEILRKSECA